LSRFIFFLFFRVFRVFRGECVPGSVVAGICYHEHMAAEKALALVVRGTDWSETSRITTLFTLVFKAFPQARRVKVTKRVTRTAMPKAIGNADEQRKAVVSEGQRRLVCVEGRAAGISRREGQGQPEGGSGSVLAAHGGCELRTCERRTVKARGAFAHSQVRRRLLVC
jgi:hypothetical protein